MKRGRTQIHQLTIKAPGLSPEQGRELGQLVANKLARLQVANTREIQTLRISHQSQSSTSVSSLADQIVKRVSRKLS